MYRTLFFLILLGLAFADEETHDLVSNFQEAIKSLGDKFGGEVQSLNQDNQELLTQLMTELKALDTKEVGDVIEKEEKDADKFKNALDGALQKIKEEVEQEQTGTDKKQDFAQWAPEGIEHNELAVVEENQVSELADVVEQEAAAPKDPSVVFVLFLFVLGLSILGFAVYYLSQQKASRVVWHQDEEIENLITNDSYYQGGDCIAA